MPWRAEPSQRRRAPRASGFLGLLGAATEALDLATGVDDALRSGEERMAHRAHLGLQLRERGAGGEGVAAEAMHLSIDVVLGMDRGFHWGRLGSRGRDELTIPRSWRAQSSAMATGRVKLP